MQSVIAALILLLNLGLIAVFLGLIVKSHWKRIVKLFKRMRSRGSKTEPEKPAEQA